MIDCVLATDMSHHFGSVKTLKDKLESQELDLTNEKDRLAFLKFAFHLADISNPVKSFELCREWTDLLFVEFFTQGDLEKQHGFKVSYLMDRHVTNIAKEQIGFCDFIIKPAYQILTKVCPELEFLIEQMEGNKKQWNENFDTYEQRMNNGNYYMKGVID